MQIVAIEDEFSYDVNNVMIENIEIISDISYESGLEDKSTMRSKSYYHGICNELDSELLSLSMSALKLHSNASDSIFVSANHSDSDSIYPEIPEIIEYDIDSSDDSIYLSTDDSNSDSTYPEMPELIECDADSSHDSTCMSAIILIAT